jgi:hypothetical protein
MPKPINLIVLALCAMLFIFNSEEYASWIQTMKLSPGQASPLA